MKIYNSLTRKKEPFQPRNPHKVKMYVCGPTVYDFAHIGNARTYAAFDVVVRYLRFRSYDVTYVRNITDIDDKIIKRANENKEGFEDVVNRFTQAIHEDFSKLGLLIPDHEPRATAYIPEIIAFIEKLIANNNAYIASNGDVYYDVRSFANYGALAHRNIDQLESGARVEINDVKRDPLDFVLWKLAKPGEPSWESPWGAGRPGWHIECSAMTTSLLGEQFDIHGGGKDLIFPHHENEIAQSEAVSQKKFVNIWMHAGFLQIEKTKMSKSLGNFFTIRDVLAKYPAEVLRYFLIMSHYRSPIQYSEDGLMQAEKALERLYNTLRDLPLTEAPMNSPYEEKFVAVMDDDFNTPIAFSVLFDLAHEVQRLKQTDINVAGSLGALLKKLGSVLHILQDDPEEFFKVDNADLDVAKIEDLIAKRNSARATKNWVEADRVRAELSAMSIVLEDNAKGTTWKYIK